MKAIIFNYLVNNRVSFHTNTEPVRLDGLNADKQYAVEEINLYPNSKSSVNTATIYSGNFLMTVGINPNINSNRTSVILELTEVKNYGK